MIINICVCTACKHNLLGLLVTNNLPTYICMYIYLVMTVLNGRKNFAKWTTTELNSYPNKYVCGWALDTSIIAVMTYEMYILQTISRWGKKSKKYRSVSGCLIELKKKTKKIFNTHTILCIFIMGYWPKLMHPASTFEFQKSRKGS